MEAPLGMCGSSEKHKTAVSKQGRTLVGKSLGHSPRSQPTVTAHSHSPQSADQFKLIFTSGLTWTDTNILHFKHCLNTNVSIFLGLEFLESEEIKVN